MGEGDVKQGGDRDKKGNTRKRRAYRKEENLERKAYWEQDCSKYESTS